MDNLPTEPDVKKPPLRRKPPVVLYLMIAASFSAVLGTVLLSRDMQHLRSIAAAFGIDISSVAAPKPDKLVFLGPPRPSNRIRINSRFLTAPDVKIATAFRRAWQMSGPDMCKALKSAGIEPTEWQPAIIGGNTFECSYDKVYRKAKDKIESSLFVIVRGNAQGMINSMRVKLVDPALDASGNLDPQLLKVFETMLTQSRWGEFTKELEAIRTLKDVKQDGFGAAMRFSQEYNDKKSYNFVLNLQALTAEQRRANALFSESGWVENARPQAPLQQPADPMAPNMPQIGAPPLPADPLPLPLPPDTEPAPLPNASPPATKTPDPAATKTTDPAQPFAIPNDPVTGIRQPERNQRRFNDDRPHR